MGAGAAANRSELKGSESWGMQWQNQRGPKLLGEGEERKREGRHLTRHPVCSRRPASSHPAPKRPVGVGRRRRGHVRRAPGRGSAIPLHPPLLPAGDSARTERECQQNDETLADGVGSPSAGPGFTSQAGSRRWSQVPLATLATLSLGHL